MEPDIIPGRCRRLSFLPVRILKFRFSHRTDRTGWKTSCQIDQALCNGCFWHQRFTKGPQRNFRNFEILKSYKHVLGRAPDATFAFHRKIQITRHAGGVRTGGVVLRVEDEGPLTLGGCTGTVTECGEHGNRKKMNPEDKKNVRIPKQDEFN